MYEQDVQAQNRSPGDGDSSPVKQKAQEAGQAAKEGAQDVAGTVKEQGRQVTEEARTQVRSVASDLRTSVTGQARTQNQRLAGGLRQMADQFHEMGPGDDSPAGQVVRRLGDGGRRAADYLEDRGPEGLLDDVQDFARRKPGTFLLMAAVAGFAVGRLGRTAMSVSRSDSSPSPSSGRSPDALPEGDGLYRSATVTEAPTTTAPTTGYEAPAVTTAYEPPPLAYDEPPVSPPLSQPGGPR